MEDIKLAPELNKTLSSRSLHGVYLGRYTKDETNELVASYYDKKWNDSEISKEFNIPHYEIQYYRKRIISSVSRYKNCGVPNIPHFNDKVALSYILGVLPSDGYINRHRYVVLDVTDLEFAQSFQKALNDIGLRANEPYKILDKRCKQRFRWCVHSGSVSFCRWYKSLTPNDIKKIVYESRETKLAYVRGFYESDGRLEKHVKCISIYNTKKYLLVFVQEILNSLDYKSYFRASLLLASKKILYTLSMSSFKSMKLLSEMKPCIRYNREWYNQKNQRIERSI